MRSFGPYEIPCLAECDIEVKDLDSCIWWDRPLAEGDVSSVRSNLGDRVDRLVTTVVNRELDLLMTVGRHRVRGRVALLEVRVELQLELRVVVKMNRAYVVWRDHLHSFNIIITIKIKICLIIQLETL